MSRILLAATLAAGLAPPAAVIAQPVGPPPRPGEIADAWLLQSHGQILCRLTLSGRATRTGSYYGADIPAACHDALPPAAAGWKPIPDGLALVSADGQALIAFTRWSESLYVSSGPATPDLQLARAPMTQKAR